MQTARTRRIRQVALIFCGCIALFICFFAIDTRSEAERVEAETITAVRKLQILNSNKVKQAPVFAVEMILRSTFGKEDARNHYMEQFDLGMQRLLELGVLEKRSFVIRDTNAYGLFMKGCMNVTPVPEVLWQVSQTTGGVDIVAKPAEMPQWQAAIERSINDAASARNSGPK